MSTDRSRTFVAPWSEHALKHRAAAVGNWEGAIREGTLHGHAAYTSLSIGDIKLLIPKSPHRLLELLGEERL